MGMDKGKYNITTNGPIHGSVHGDYNSVTMHLHQSESLAPLPTHRGIVASLPLTDSSKIQPRTSLVESIVERLIQRDFNVLVLTGIGGLGKSTLAALVYRSIEAQHHTGTSLFASSPLWLRIDATTTFADLIGTICQVLDVPIPDLRSLSPANQAQVLYNVLATADSPRLIVLDQFEYLLDWETGKALESRPGVGEWLDALNSQLWNSGYRLILTSRPCPRGTRQEALFGIQEYHVSGLTIDEGIDLLHKRGVQARDTDYYKAVMFCDGHALSLTLLIDLVQIYKIPLTTLLKDTTLWSGNIAEELLDVIFEQLNEVQCDLLRAFSVYRKPVPIEAAQAMFLTLQKKQATTELHVLLAQNLVQALGEGKYQVHTIVSSYAKQHFAKDDEKNNEHAVLKTYEKAAQYYVQQVAIQCYPHNQQQKENNIHLSIEAVWYYCQASLCKEAYGLIVQKDIFTEVKSRGDYATLLELYELLFPLNKWQPKDRQIVQIYNDLGRIYSDLEKKEYALECYHKALEISKNLGNSEEQSRTLNNLGWIYAELGDNERSQEYFEQALYTSIQSGDYRREASIRNGLGRLFDNQGRKELAREYYEQALKIYREHKENLKGEAWTLNNLGKIYADLGNREQALDYLEQALEIRRDVLKNQWETGRTLKNLGEIYTILGSTRDALKCLEEALSISRELGDRRGEGCALNGLGQIYKVLGGRAKALNYFQQALNIHRETRDCRHEARTLVNQGILFADLPEQQNQASENYKTALKLYREVGDRWGENITLQQIEILCSVRANFPSCED